MKDPAAPASNVFDKLIAITKSESFLNIRRQIIQKRLHQHPYFEAEKFHKLADDFELSLVWTIEYDYFIQQDWLTPCFLKNSKGIVLPFPAGRYKSDRYLKTAFFHRYRILELSNCVSKGKMTRDTLIIWWRRKKNRRKALSHVKDWDKAVIGLFAPFRLRALVEFGIVLEPLFLPGIKGRLTLRGLMDDEFHFSETDTLREELVQLTSSFSKADWKQLHDEANFISGRLSENDELKTLITLMRNDDQSKIKGRLGASLVAREVAQLIRYLAFHNKVELEEEQFSESPGYTSAYFKLFRGSKTIVNGPRENRLKFVRGFGLDFGARVRLYVEGATEYFCFQSILGHFGFVEIIDLKGAFWQKGGKGVAFKESLRNDKASHMYSLIVLDGDRDDNIRVIRAAAKDGVFLGQFYINNPDFELENFSKQELAEIISSDIKVKVDPGIFASSSSAKEVFASLHQSIPVAKKFVKGEKWGRLLGDFSANHPRVEHFGFTGDRIINQVVRFCQIAATMNFSNDVSSKKVDEISGRMENK